jgi:hypothetical protein
VKKKINKNIIFILCLSLFSFLFNFYYAYQGIFPIDSFLIFDAAHNIISGNHPFKDYWLITGPFLDYIQSFFFLIFGTNWFSYVFHASLLNMMLSLFSFYFFLKIGLKYSYAFIYSLGVAALAYPSIGTPFIDHHAVIFSLFALYSISLGILLQNKLYWFLTPLFIIFSFFSKQIPSAYLLFLFVPIISFYFYKIEDLKSKNFKFLILGMFFSIIIILSVFIINSIPFKNFLIQYILYPISLGDNRINRLNIDFQNLIGQFKFIYLSLIPLLISLFFLIKKKKRTLFEKKLVFVSFLFIGTIGILIYCQLLTKNQVLIFFLIPIAAAFSHAYTIKYFNKKYLIIFIMTIFIFSSFKYHIRFNEGKKFMELVDVDISLSVDAKQLDKRLAGLRWITPEYNQDPQNEIQLLKDVKKILYQKKDRKILITDYQFFSSLLRNKFASPNKWYDNLSIPDKKNKYYNDHRVFFLEKIRNNKIQYLYFIGKNKHDMPFFKELSNKNDCIVSSRLNKLLVEFNINNCKILY